MDKQHLRIKSFFGASENVVKNTNLDCHLRFMRSPLSLFEKTLLDQLLRNNNYTMNNCDIPKTIEFIRLFNGTVMNINIIQSRGCM